MSVKLKAAGDQILCELIIEEKTQGGLFIPQVVQDTTPVVRSRVVAIGKTAIEQADICVGDIVLSNQGYGTKIEIDKKKYMNLKVSSQVAAILHEENAELEYKTERDWRNR